MDHLLQECRLALRNLHRMPQLAASVRIVLASLLPALRAASIQPAEALRQN